MKDAKLLVIWAVFGLSFSACQSVPKHEICQLYPVKNNSNCIHTKKPKAVYHKPIKDLDKWICRSVDHEQQVLEWIKRTRQGCHPAPRHTVCQLNVPRSVSYCVDTGKPELVKTINISQMDKYVCRTIDSEQMIIEWVKRTCGGN